MKWYGHVAILLGPSAPSFKQQRVGKTSGRPKKRTDNTEETEMDQHGSRTTQVAIKDRVILP